MSAPHGRLMNKNIQPGKTLRWRLLDGTEYLKVALTAKSKGTRQTAWVLFKEFWLWPLIFLARAHNLLASGFR